MSQPRAKSFPWVKHLSAIGVLSLLDLHHRLRRRIGRNFMRVGVGILSLVLLGIVLSSIFALIQITRSMQSLVGDSMVGLEEAVAMRAAVRETQLDLLRLRLASGRKLSLEEVDAFRKEMADRLTRYHLGVYDEADLVNERAIDGALRAYLEVLAPLIDNEQPDTARIQFADDAARHLVNVVEVAYQFNRARIHRIADDVGHSAQKALRMANWLGWSFGLFISGVAVIYLSYRSLALPEDGDA